MGRVAPKGDKMFRYMFLFLIFIMVGCSSKKVEVDYNPEFKTTALATFFVVHKMDEYNSLNNERISEAIINEMKLKGYMYAQKDEADFHIIFHTITKEDIPSNVGFGFGFGTFSRGQGLSLGSVHHTTGDKDSHFINMIGTKTQKSFWSASLTQRVDDFKSPQERIDHFNKTVKTMLNDFPKKSK